MCHSSILRHTPARETEIKGLDAEQIVWTLEQENTSLPCTHLISAFIHFLEMQDEANLCPTQLISFSIYQLNRYLNFGAEFVGCPTHLISFGICQSSNEK